MQNGNVIHILQSVLHWAHWAIIMAPKYPKISKHSCWHNKGQDMNKSGDTTNS